LRIQHERARNYYKGSGHDRKKQPDDASNHKNPPQSNDGDALEWLLRLGDSNLLHSESPILQLVTSSCISIVLTFSAEHRREGEGGLSQPEGIFRRKFNYTVHVKRGIISLYRRRTKTDPTPRTAITARATINDDKLSAFSIHQFCVLTSKLTDNLLTTADLPAQYHFNFQQ
jgi:hypothetical protein